MSNEKDKVNFYEILGVDWTVHLRNLKLVYIKKLERMKNSVCKGENKYSLLDIKILNKAYLGLCSPIDRYLHDCHLDDKELIFNPDRSAFYKSICEGNCDFSAKDDKIFINIIDDVIISLSMEGYINTGKDSVALKECLESLEEIKEKLKEGLKNKPASKTLKRRK